MTIRKRLRFLEAKTPDPEPTDDYPSAAFAIRQLDILIQRLGEHVAQEKTPDGYVEGADDDRYGDEPIKAHTERVDALMDADREREKAWRREHRPDLPEGCPLIDDHIAELKAEIALIEAEEGEG